MFWETIKGKETNSYDCNIKSNKHTHILGMTYYIPEDKC
jgi:hypothetical protein